jgi:aspartate/methionine/tyrosine aminotransferase
MSQRFVPSQLGRLLGEWEHKVEYDLSGSIVYPMSIQELVEDPQLVEELLTTELGYVQTNGSVELRERIAALYPGANPDNVLVTVGAAQANFTTILTVLEPGDEIVMMLPTYRQIWVIAQNFGFSVKHVFRKEELGWGIDPDELDRTVSNKTKLIVVCNPNNPTGHIMSQEEMDAVVAVAARSGAWLLADEVNAGAERVTEEVTPTFWGRYDRVLATNSMSKVYSLPGLRIGWVVAPSDIAERIWSRQDYITICTTKLSNKLAAHALAPDVRSRILSRNRVYIREEYRNLEAWCEEHGDMFSLVPPQASPIAFIRYNREINSVDLVDRLIKEKQTLAAPGKFFGVDHHLRIGFCLPADYLYEGLERLNHVLSSCD